MPHTKRSKHVLVLRIAWISLPPINCVRVLVSLKMELLSLEANWHCDQCGRLQATLAYERLWEAPLRKATGIIQDLFDFVPFLPSHPLGCDPGVASCSHCGSWEDRVTADPSHVYISNVSPSFPPCHLAPHQPLIMWHPPPQSPDKALVGHLRLPHFLLLGVNMID